MSDLAAALDLIVRRAQSEQRIPSVSAAVFRDGDLLLYLPVVDA